MIGGFNDQGDGTEVKTNRVTITKGDVQGPVYGGLSFVSKIFADVDKSSYPVIPDNSADEQSTSYNNKQTVNHNQVEVKGHVTISNGDVHGGNVSYWNQIANVTAGTAQLDSSTSQHVAASATAEAFAAFTGNASADENKVLVRQWGKVDNGIYGGRVTIRAATGDAKAGNTTGVNSSSWHAYATAIASILTHTQAGSSANVNKVVIEDFVNIKNSDPKRQDGLISGGNILINTSAGNADNASITASSSAIANDRNQHTDSKAFANAKVTSFAGATATANDNKVTIGQKALIDLGITGGSLTIFTNAGNATAGNAKAKNNSINDASASIEVDAKAIATASTNVSEAAANNNQVDVQGANTIISNGVIGGNVVIRTRAGNATAGKATAENNSINNASGAIDAYADATVNASANVSAEANNNQVIVQGANTTISRGVIGGNVLITTIAGDATASDAIINNAYAPNADILADATALTIATTGKVSTDENKVLVGQGVIVRGGVVGGKVEIKTEAGSASAGKISTAAKVDASQLNNLATVSAINNISASANGNTVTIEQGAQVEGNIAVGQIRLDLDTGNANDGQLVNGVTTTGDAKVTIDVSNTQLQANHNQIYMDGLIGTGHIYGGYIGFNIDPKSNDTVSLIKTVSNVQAINNIITIGEHAEFAQSNSSLYGWGFTLQLGLCP